MNDVELCTLLSLLIVIFVLQLCNFVIVLLHILGIAKVDGEIHCC